MSIWLERFKSHAVHEHLNTLRQSLKNVPKTEDKEAKAFIRRLRKVERFIRSVIAEVDAELTTAGALQAVAKPVQHVAQFVDSYCSDSALSHLQAADGHADTALDNIRLLRPLQGADTPGLAESVRDLQTASHEIIEGMAARVTDSTSALDDLREAIEDNRATLEKQTEEVEAQKGRLDSAIARFEEQFSNAEESRRSTHAQTLEAIRSEHKTAVEEMEEARDASLTQFDAKFEGLSEKLQTEGEQRVNALEETKEKAKNLLQIVTNIGVTGEFQKTAENERKAADFMRKIALGCLGVLVLGVVAVISVTILKGFSWDNVLSRLAILLTLLFPYHYAARESRRHRMSERRNRRLQLDLSSIDPFIENLPAEKRDELRVKLADRLFAQAAEPQAEDRAGLTRDLVDITKTLAKKG